MNQKRRREVEEVQEAVAEVATKVNRETNLMRTPAAMHGMQSNLLIRNQVRGMQYRIKQSVKTTDGVMQQHQ